MVALSGEIKELFNRTKVMPLATASKSGVPTWRRWHRCGSPPTTPSGSWITNMQKTLKNLQENPVAALSFHDPETKRCFQVKGSTEIRTSGPDYEKFRDWMRSKSDKYPAKSLIIMKITDVFECTPGKDAGKKVL